MIKSVKKRGGDIVPFDYDKMNQWAQWAADNCEGVFWSDVLFKAVRTLHDEIDTTDVHQALIDACLTYRTEGHTAMAARLMMGVIYKEAFDDFSVPSLSDFYNEMVDNSHWRDMGYTEEELYQLDQAIDHSRDFTYSYATVKQFYDKYSVRAYDKILESPQMAFLGLAMSNMSEEPNRVDEVITAYHKESQLKINLPTPTVVLERTPALPAPSCCVIKSNDTVKSIGAAQQVAYDMTAASSGIGIELTTRAPKDPVKGGKLEHGGKHSYYSLLDRTVKANSQMTRGGSATVTYNALDPEILSLLTLKQHRTDETYKIVGLDYSMAINELFLKKVAQNKEWMTISPLFGHKLWELSYAGEKEAFEDEYERLLQTNVKKKMINAREIFAKWVTARGDQGRVYLSFLDNMNWHTPFLDAIFSANLCQEIGLPTEGFDGVADLYKAEPEVPGEVALCSLGSVVASQIESQKDHEETIYTLAKIIDNTIEKSVYPFPHVERTAKARRSIGIGITDLAHLMAKKGLKYDTQEGRTFMHELAEDQAFFLLKASVRLAKERGPCEWMHKTKYDNAVPWLPIDTYNKEVDKHHDAVLRHDWEGLREDIKMYGVRFSVESALMPTESSSLLTNSCNSIYPIRQLEQYKASRKGMVYFRAPGMDTLDYQFAYDIHQNDMVKVYAIFQKFTSQSISADFYTKLDGEEKKLSMKDMLTRVFLASKLGMKNFYYENYLTGSEAAALEQELLVVEEQDDMSCCKL